MYSHVFIFDMASHSSNANAIFISIIFACVPIYSSFNLFHKQSIPFLKFGSISELSFFVLLLLSVQSLSCPHSFIVSDCVLLDEREHDAGTIRHSHAIIFFVSTDSIQCMIRRCRSCRWSPSQMRIMTSIEER